MKIDFNVPLLNLDGTPATDGNQIVTLGKVFSNVLVSQPEGDIIKLFDWALQMHRGNPVNLDRADRELLRKFVTNCNTITILLKKRLLEVIDPISQNENNVPVPVPLKSGEN